MSTAHHRRRPKPVLSIVNNTATLAVLAKEVVHVLLATTGDHNIGMTNVTVSAVSDFFFRRGVNTRVSVTGQTVDFPDEALCGISHDSG
jgi:hypothetical protein